MVRDFSRYALQLYGKPVTNARQQWLLRRMIRRPVVNGARFEKIWAEHVATLRGAYEMSEEPVGERAGSVADVA